MSFFFELKRRKVVRTTIAYLAAAFVTAQAVQLIVDGLELPGWIFKAVLITLIAALPLVIGLAWAFDVTERGIERTETGDNRPQTTISGRRLALPAAGSLLLLLALAAFFSFNRNDTTSLNDNLVAVMPFHVSGDPQIAYLREGMVDLLAAKLTGEGGPRAADPRASMSIAKSRGDVIPDSTAAEIAREIGSGKVLVGSIVGTPAQFTMNARLISVPNGRVIAKAEEVANATTLLPAVDKLVATLLSLQAGESLQRLDVLTTTSLPALRAYLEAQREYRSSHFGKASELFGRAIELDSTFALAAVGQTLSYNWGEGPPIDADKVRRIARRYSERLGQVDRAMVVAVYGEADKPRSTAQRFAAYERVVSLAPDRADAWFLYADLMSHWGNIADRNQVVESDALFDRVLKVDSSYTPAILHLIDNAIFKNDLAKARKLDARRKRHDPDETAALYQRAYRIRFLGDSAALRAEQAAIDTMSLQRLMLVSFVGGVSPGGVSDAMKAMERATTIATTDAERVDVNWSMAMLYAMYGMPKRAAAAMDNWRAATHEPTLVAMLPVLNALYDNGDIESARRSLPLLDSLASASPSLTTRVRTRCALEQWHLWQRVDRDYRAAALELARTPADSALARSDADVCVQVLATINAMLHEPAALSQRVQALNALMKDGPAMNHTLRNAANIVLSRAAERMGDQRLAYRAMSRIPFHPAGMWLTGSMHRERARLAALNGEVDTAILEYTHYLNMHEQAEPSFKKIDDAARAHLASLTGEKR